MSEGVSSFYIFALRGHEVIILSCIKDGISSTVHDQTVPRSRAFYTLCFLLDSFTLCSGHRACVRGR